MTSNTEESLASFRYHIYVKEELVCLSKTKMGVKGFIQAFAEESEYRGCWVTVHDTFHGDLEVVEGGSKAPSADILPFTRK
jgi:hypothetical protein